MKVNKSYKDWVIKYSIPVFLLLVSIGFTNCGKGCDLQIITCKEKVPEEDCEAYFKRWFYNETKNQCEQIGYSGCSQKGFATKQECEECKCR